jgi:Ca-activated chloride channel family protein
MHVSVRLDHALLAVDGEHDVHAMLELSAPEAPGDSERAPLRLALVLDRSGSMAGAKLEVAKRCAAWLVGRLHGSDELALVAYDDEVRLLAPLGQVTRPELRAALAGVGPGGQTNLSGGWLKGLEELRRAPAKVPRKIVLLTDGLANVGITDAGQLAGLAEGAYRDGIGTTTIGFGEGFDEDLLTQMAGAGGGNAHYAPTPDAAPGIFAQELEGLTSLVAQNVSVELQPVAAVELLTVLNDYPAAPVAGGVQLALGDAYGGERRRVVFALHLPHLAVLGPTKVADCVLRYVSVGDEVAEHTVTIPVVANLVSADEAAAAARDLEVQEEVLVLQAARARDEAIRLADTGDYRGARATLKNAAATLRSLAPTLSPEHAAALETEAAELEEGEAHLAPTSYNAAMRKKLHYEANLRHRRRQ